MKTKITYIETSITEIKDMLKEHIDYEAKKYETFDNKYVDKESFEQLNDKVSHIDSKASFGIREIVYWGISLLLLGATLFTFLA